MFNIDTDFIERLKHDGYDDWTISLWGKWLEKSSRLAAVIQQIRDAFHDVQLADGIGLLEANGMDDYADETELAQLRSLDERESWRNIEPALFGQYNFTPGYFDPAGFVFHLPGFLIAELNDEIDIGFIDRIIERQPVNGGWIDALTSAQADAIVATLSLVKHHPDCYDAISKFDHAIDRFLAFARESDSAG